MLFLIFLIFTASATHDIHHEPKLRLWQNYKNYFSGGKDIAITDSVRDLSTLRWNNITSHVDAERGTWILYKDTNFGGDYRIINEGESLELHEGWQNQLSSVRFIGKTCVNYGIAYRGADFRVIKDVSTLKMCINLCYHEAECMAVSHIPTKGDCWLKSLPYGNLKLIKAEVNSVNMECLKKKAKDDFETRCVMKNVDFYGANIKIPPVTNVPTIKDCAVLCFNTANCRSVTHNKSTQTCWLKYNRLGDSPTPKNGFNSVDIACARIPKMCL